MNTSSLPDKLFGKAVDGSLDEMLRTPEVPASAAIPEASAAPYAPVGQAASPFLSLKYRRFTRYFAVGSFIVWTCGGFGLLSEFDTLHQLKKDVHAYQTNVADLKPDELGQYILLQKKLEAAESAIVPEFFIEMCGVIQAIAVVGSRSGRTYRAKKALASVGSGGTP